MNKTKVFFAPLLGTLLLSAPLAVLADDDNVLRDASFENRLAPDQGGWQTFQVSYFSEDQARSGNGSMFNGGMSRAVSHQPFFLGNVSGSFQETEATAGSRWRLTGYGLAATELQGNPAFGVVQISFFDADGNDLGTVETAGGNTKAVTSNEVNSLSTVGEWIELDTGIATAPADTAVVQAFTIYVDYSGSGVSQGVFFDDLVLCRVDADGSCESD